MARCGECVNFVLLGTYEGADSGYCNAFIQDDGIGVEVGVENDASKCSKYKEMDRIRTDTLEFSFDPLLRPSLSFEEK